MGDETVKVLIACEESQTVCTAFRELGHEVYSCDIQGPSGGHPEWHILGDALVAIEGGQVTTMDGQTHDVGRWDLLIAHPPCTHLANSGAAHFAKKRADGRQQQGIDFFMQFANANLPKIAIENPVGIMSKIWRKPDQIIHPWWFGDNAEKQTCLWLKGIPLLKQEVEERPLIEYHEWTAKDGRRKRQELWYYKTRCLPQKERGKAASKTFPGIARAMAEQWGGQCSG